MDGGGGGGGNPPGSLAARRTAIERYILALLHVDVRVFSEFDVRVLEIQSRVELETPPEEKGRRVYIF